MTIFFSLLLAQAGCARQQGSPCTPDVPVARSTLGNFTVTAAPDADNLVTASLLYKGREIAKDGPLRDVRAEQAVPDPVRPECQHLKAELFTGGANCCFGYYLLADCGGEDFAGYMEPYGGNIGDLAAVPGGNAAAYPAMDDAFMYYGPKDAAGKTLFTLSRVESPRPERLIVFANGWRADVRGEFPAAYAAKAAAVRSNKNAAKIARAVTAAYYDLMAGKPAKTAASALKRDLPGEYVAFAAVILADINTAIDRFNPVANRPLAAVP